MSIYLCIIIIYSHSFLYLLQLLLVELFRSSLSLHNQQHLGQKVEDK